MHSFFSCSFLAFVLKYKQRGVYMKIFKRIAIASGIIVLTAIISFVMIFIYEDQYKKKEVYRESNPDGDLVFVLYQVGQPEWPFGPVKAQVCVLDSKGKTVDKEAIVIHTDGAQLNEFYLDEVTWSENVVEVVCSGEDGTKTYVLELEN